MSGDIEGFIRKIPDINKRDKPVNTTGIAKIHLGRDCFTGSIVNGIREPILFSFGLSSPTGHERYKEPRIKPFKLINLFLSHITFNLEDDDHKAVDFNRETISFFAN